MKKKIKFIFLFLLFSILLATYFSANVYNEFSFFPIRCEINSGKIEEVRDLVSHLKQSGLYNEAIDICKKYIKKSYEKDKNYLDILKEISVLKYYTGDYIGSEKILKFLIKFYENDLETNFNFGRVLFEKRKYVEAINYFKKVKEINPDFLASYFYLGKTYQKIFEIFEENESKNKDFNLLKKKLYDLIIKNFNTVTKKDPYFLETRMLLANFYIKNKNFDEAFGELTKIKNTYSKSNEVNFLIENIFPYVSKDVNDKNIDDMKNVYAKMNLYKFRPFSRFKNKKNQKIRVGINSNQKGLPCKDDTFYFYANNDFTVNSYKKNKINRFYLKKFERYKITLKKGVLYLFDSKDKLLSTSKKKIYIYSNLNYSKNSFIIETIDVGMGFTWHKNIPLQYRGDIEFSIYEDSINIINVLDIEEYLYGVIPSEIMGHWPKESHKAQAILARTYAMYTKNVSKVHKNHNYDICSSQHCQVYNGVNVEIEHMNKSVDDTYNKVLKFNKKLINGLYHSNSGGFVQSSSNIKNWGNAPYLENVFEGYDEDEKKPIYLNDIETFIKNYPKCYSNDKILNMSMSSFRWVRIVEPKYIEEKIKFNRDLDIGDIIDIIVLKRSPSGNVNQIKIIGKKSELILEKENHIRFYLGLNSMRSTMIWIEKKYNKKSKNIDEFIIYGGGWGHGVGMSQTGAAGMANKGKNYEDILYFYFPNTKIENI